MPRNVPDPPPDSGPVRGGTSGRATPDLPIRVRGGGDGRAEPDNEYNYGRKVWSGGPGGSTSVSESSVSFSSTILDAVVPVVYGTRKVSGLCAAIKQYTGAGGWLHLAYVFSYGEQDSITDLQLNDTPITDPELAGAIFNVNYRYGAAGETVPTHIADKLPDDARMVRYCYVTFTIKLDQLTLPGALNVSAILGGRKVEPVAGVTGGTKVASTNPVLVANDIMTDAVAWKGIDETVIHQASWLAAAEHCDELVSGEARYSYNARVTERNPERAAAEALMHGMANTFNDVGGSIRVWQERRPPAASGTWSTSGSSTTITRDGAGDDFDADYTGKRVFFGNDHRKVVTRVSATEVTVDEAITLTAATLYYPSGVELQPTNMVNTPAADEIELGSVPDVVIIKYTDSDFWGSIQYPELVADSVIKRKEVQLYGCIEAGMAARHSETRRDIDRLQPFLWQLAADGIAAPVEPGDVLFFTDDVLTNQAAMVMPPVEALKSGAYKLNLRQFNMAAYSQATATKPSQLDPVVLPLGLPTIGYSRVTNDVPDKWGDVEYTEVFNWDADVSSVNYPGRYEVVIQGEDLGGVYSDAADPWIDLQTVEFTQGFVQLAKVGGGPTDYLSRQLLGASKGITDYRLLIKEKGRADRRLMTEDTSSNYNPAPPARADGMTQRYNGSTWEIAYLESGDVSLTTTPTGLLAGDTTVDDALTALDGLIKGMNGGGSGSNFANDASLSWDNKTATASISGFRINGSDQAQIGADLILDGYARLPNNTYLYGRNAAGTADVWIAGVNASNEVIIGSGSYTTRVVGGGTLYLTSGSAITENNGWLLHPNAYGTQIKESGGTARTVLTVSASNEVGVGHTALDMNLYAAGTIDAQDNDIITTGNIEAAEGDIDRRQNAKTKTLTLGGANTFAQCYVSGTPGGASITLHYEIIVDNGTDVQIEAGDMTFAMYRTSGGTQVGTYAKAGTVNQTSFGSLSVTGVIYTATPNLMIVRVTPTSVGLSGTPTCVMNFSVTGNGARQIVWI